MQIAPVTDEQAALNALTFPKVSIGGGNITMSGYLTDLSAKMLLVELERAGFKMKRDNGWSQMNIRPEYQRRDFYWKRVGWRYEVWTEIAGHHHRVGDFRFWCWRTAARVRNEIFGAYLAGRDAERSHR